MIVWWSGRNLLINFLGMINKQLSSYLLHWLSVIHPAMLTGFVLCMVSFSWWPSLSTGRLHTIIIMLLIMILLLMPLYLSQIRWVTLRQTGYFFIGVIIAWLYCDWIGHQYIQTSKSLNFNTPIWVQGEVTSLHHEDVTQIKKVGIQLRVSQVNHQPVTPFKIKLNWYYPKIAVLQGQQWQFLVKLKPARGLANEAGFDYHRYLIGQEILATGYVKKSAQTKLIKQDISLVQEILTAMNTYPLSHQAWIQALILGHRYGLSKQHKDLIRQTGTAHLFVISGLHIGIVAGWIYLFFHSIAKVIQLLTRRTFSIMYMLIATLIGTWSYCYILGFTIPMLRAFIVVVLCLYIHFKQLNISLWHKCLICLSGVLVCFPFSSFNTGFWLSFIAVIIIGFIVHCISISVRTRRDKSMAFIIIQLALTLLLMPINIIVFGQFYPWSFVANLWAIPIVTLFLVPIGMVLLTIYVIHISVDLMWLNTVLSIGMWLANTGFVWLISGLEQIIQVPYLSQVLAPVFSSLNLKWSLCLLLAMLWVFILYKQWRLWGWCVLLIPAGMGIWGKYNTLNEVDTLSPQMTFTMFDVGQGSSAQLSVNEHAFIFDVGDDFGERFNMVNSVLLPYFNAHSNVHPKALYISHFDKDHAGGIDRFKQHFPQTPMFSPRSGCWQGQSQQWPYHVKVDVLWPPKAVNPHSFSNNNASCVLRITLPNAQHILITGDIESQAEKALVHAHDQGFINLAADLLIVPHHGSQTSSTSPFIQRVAPEYALVSVGFMNRYRLPNSAVIQRYLDANITVLSTAQVGQITLTWSDEKPTSKPHISTARGSEFVSWFHHRWYESD